VRGRGTQRSGQATAWFRLPRIPKAASGLPFCASVVAFRGSEPDSAFFPTVRRLDRRRPAGGRIMNNKKSTFKQLF